MGRCVREVVAAFRTARGARYAKCQLVRNGAVEHYVTVQATEVGILLSDSTEQDDPQ